MTTAVARPAPGRCDHWDGAAGWYCGAAETRPYLTGDRCPRHTPAAIAGRPEPPVPDPAMTIQGLRRAWEERHARIVEQQRRRAAGLKVFRGPSGPHGRYTSADVAYDAVHRAERAVGDLLEQRRQGAPAGRS